MSRGKPMSNRPENRPSDYRQGEYVAHVDGARLLVPRKEAAMPRALTSLFAISLFASLALDLGRGSALAADGPHCLSIKEVQMAVGKDTTVAPLTPAQFHFLQGVYVVLPNTPDGLPPADGALLLTKDRGGDGLVIWTLGALVCEPMPAPEKLMKYLAAVKAGEAKGDGV
jgi:hypothetical protein